MFGSYRPGFSLLKRFSRPDQVQTLLRHGVKRRRRVTRDEIQQCEAEEELEPR